MRAISRVETKYSGGLSVYVDQDRDEVVLRDAQGNTHRLTPAQSATLGDALWMAEFTL